MQVERSEILALLRACHIFKALTDQDLEKVADQVEAYLYPENQTIYAQASEADALYFILSGRVSLSQQRGSHSDEQIREEQDYFGEESLAEKPAARKASAVAQVDAILLRLSRESLRELRKVFPALEQPLHLVLSSHNLAATVRLDWLGPRETLHYIARRHWIFLLLRFLPLMIIGGLAVGAAAYLAVVVAPESFFSIALFVALLLLGAGWLVWTAVDWSNDYAVITNRRVVSLQKILLIYDSRQEVPLDAILADDLRTSYLGRLIGYGTVLIRTYTGQVSLHQLAQPYLVIQLLKALRERSKMSQKRERREVIDRTIRQRLGYLPEDQPGEPSPVPPAPGRLSGLQKWLSELFLLRVEDGGVVTYRTHWFIMIKKTWLPAMLILAVIILILLDVLGVISTAPVIRLLLVLGVGPALFLWWLYQLVDWRNDRYLITADMIVDIYRRPLGTEEKKSAPLRNILSIDYERKGLLGLLLNFGTVYIRVGDSTFTFDNVLNPAEVQSELFQRFMEYKQREEQKTELTQRELMAEWIELYHRTVQEGRPPENPEEEQPDSG